MDVLLLTPTQKEYDIVRQYLIHPKSVSYLGEYYEIGEFAGLKHHYKIGIRETGPKIAPVALATQKAIQGFQPSLIILTGITGGVKDVTLGDVVVGTKAYGYESGKETSTGTVSRSSSLPYDKELIEFAKTIRRANNWKNRVPDQFLVPDSTVYFGPIASGDKVIASKDSPVYKTLQQSYNDTTSLEMEAIGLAEALQPYKNIRGMNIRGVSDLLDHKEQSDGQGWQEKAVYQAAGFLFELLYQLDFNNLKIYAMDPKTLAAQVIELLKPGLQLSKLFTDKSPFNEKLPETTQKIWDKVRPEIIKWAENSEEDLLDKDLHEEIWMSLRGLLRKQIKTNEKLKQNLETLLQKSASEKPSTNVQIIDSKNVIQGSDIKVGGDFHLGDNG